MLNEKQIKTFQNQGFLLVEQVLDPIEILDPIISEYTILLDDLVRGLIAEGKLTESFEDLDFRSRMTEVFKATGETFAQYFNMCLPLLNVSKDTPFWTGPAIFNLIRNAKLLDIVESIIGAEIASNPVQYVRIKPPQNIIAKGMRRSGLVGKTPWHQDAAVLPPDCGTELITVWVPINDADELNGCLQFIEGGQERDLIKHGFGPVDGLEIPQEVVSNREPVVVPAKRGDILLIHRNCPHSSLPNVSNEIRFSLDLRYNPSHQPSGREIFPSFIARSRKNPASELRDPEKWTQMWMEARHWLATSPDAPKTAYDWLR